MENKTTITFEPEHLSIISRALEAYSRAKMGQFGYMIEEIFPEKLLDWQEKEDMEKLLRQIVFPDESLMRSSSASFGIMNEKTGDGQIAYEVHKLLAQYIEVNKNDGYWGMGNRFDGPLKTSKVELPVIEDFKKYIDYPIDDRKFDELFKNKDLKNCWEFVEKMGLPKGARSEIIDRGNAVMKLDGGGYTTDDYNVYSVRIHKPKLDKEEF